MFPKSRVGQIVATTTLLFTIGYVGRAHALTRSEFHQWTALLSTGRLKQGPPGMTFWFDAHARRGDSNTVLILRPGVGAQLTPWLTLWAGYAWVPTFGDRSRGTTHEHRVWEQITLSHQTAGWSFQSRTRLEQRVSDAGDDVGHRIREFVRVNWQPDANFPMGAAFWDEIFIGLNNTDWGAPKGFDQNRLFLGPFLNPLPWARLEMGYLFAYLDRGNADLAAHVLAVNLFVSLKPRVPTTESG